jgi:pyruvate formate lyase activating enzyme
MAAQTRLRDILRHYVKPGTLYRKHDESFIECFACGHRCKIRHERDGICRLRFNQNGTLYVPHGYVSGLQADPIEKKPFFHAFPGQKAMSFGMLGCDLHCPYCQNWITSQALNHDIASSSITIIAAEQIVNAATSSNSRVITSTYNEPSITAEWALEIFKLAHAAGLACSFVSNGNGTPELLHYIRPYIDLYKIDLKSMNDLNYRKLGTRLQNVLDTIHTVYEYGIWLEIVTLVVPTFNDSDDELKSIARFLVSISPDIPWHVTAFHKNYHMTDPDDTPPETLIRAAQIGREAGLNFVYTGNLPGDTGEWENTYCPGCRNLLIERRGFRIYQNHIKNGHCPKCKRMIPGRWH